MFAALTKVLEPPRSTGLRDDFDDSAVLVCKAHYGRLRKLDARRADELERNLTQAFEDGRLA